MINTNKSLIKFGILVTFFVFFFSMTRAAPFGYALTERTMAVMAPTPYEEDEGGSGGPPPGSTPAYCGDGSVNGSEECDEGISSPAFQIEGDGCNSDCRFSRWCGDGIKQPHEDCDPLDPARVGWCFSGLSCPANCDCTGAPNPPGVG